ncbi:carboxypeptidase regulatory-like domain-containing protein [Candidatus Palauibacter sp.]|uniref:carboxypeptidase regulatory-like domain-containing protein n=1 Tax=Candidatus Palauibacter sp. TaxID=3101350 RepID=UPI003B525544
MSNLRRRWARRVFTLAILLGASSGPLAAQQAYCGDRASLLVTVLDESGSIVLPGATVVLRWTDAERMPVREATDADGRVRVCVPRDATQAVVWAEFGDHSSGQAAPEALASGEEREVRLRILSSVRSGRLIGRVVDRETGRPVATAAVSVLGRPTEAASDRQGLFRLTGVPVGQHELRVRRLGYAPLLHTVDVTTGHTTELEIGLVREPVELEPLVVSTTRSRRLEIKGFFERKHWGELLGLGTFYTVQDIERRRPLRISQMIEELPSIRMGLLNARSGCRLSVYLDNVSVGAKNIDKLVLPIEVAGVEVYRGAASLPAEFGGSDSRCGVAVVWTK